MAKLEAFLQDFDCEGTFRFVLVPLGDKTLGVAWLGHSVKIQKVLQGVGCLENHGSVG